MTRIIIHIFAALVLLIAIPSLAALAITGLWNAILPSVCGFATISFIQGLGLFALGLLPVAGGFWLGLLLVGGGMHLTGHHRNAWHKRWHSMTEQERRDFMRRRRESFGHRPTPFAQEDERL